MTLSERDNSHVCGPGIKIVVLAIEMINLFRVASLISPKVIFHIYFFLKFWKINIHFILKLLQHPLKLL
jgi:hypothetical protein